MKKTFFGLVALSLSVLSPLTYSDRIVEPNFIEELAFQLISSLDENNRTEYDETIKEYKKTTIKERIAKNHEKITFRSVDAKGNNILHFLIQFESDESFNHEYNDLLKWILDDIIAKLGNRQFFQLLHQKNEKGVSPLEEAKASEGLALNALRSFFLVHQSKSIKDIPFSASLGGAMLFVSADQIISPFSHSNPDNFDSIIGPGIFLAAGLSFCYSAFSNKIRALRFNNALR